MADGTIQQNDAHQTHPSRGQQHRLFAGGCPKVFQIRGKSDEARGDFQGAGEQELPDEEEGHQPAPSLAAKSIAQEMIAAAGSGHGRAKFTPHQSIGQRQNQRHQPAQHRLRPAQRGHQDRDGDERPDAHHVGHVHRGGLHHANATLHAGFIRRCGIHIHITRQGSPHCAAAGPAVRGGNFRFP